MKLKIITLIFATILFITGCATYYQKSLYFQEQFVKGEIAEANKILDKNKKAAKDKNRLLYFLQKGVVLQMLGEYEKSNSLFFNLSPQHRQILLHGIPTVADSLPHLSPPRSQRLPGFVWKPFEKVP